MSITASWGGVEQRLSVTIAASGGRGGAEFASDNCC